MQYIGIDLGTSAVKLLLVDDGGAVRKSVSREYPLHFPRPGWSEQDPEDWWNAVLDGLKELTENGSVPVAGLSAAGQMHGLVILDENDEVIRPAILWNDGRTEKETRWLNETVGTDLLRECTGNIAFAGFTAPKILWLQKHEPENFSKIKKIMLPKDYITYRLTGAFVSDYSDAAGTLLLNVKEKCWSQRMMNLCGVKEAQLPALCESYEKVGTVQPDVAAAAGLSPDAIVAAGAGDNAGSAVGTGAVTNGRCNLSIGTSGTVFISTDAFPTKTDPAIHNFAHANGKFHLMGCMLSAASCNGWFCKDVLETNDYNGEQDRIPADLPGRNDVYFLPYLMGERSPINDTFARGCFVGLRPDTGRSAMLLAVLEGVAFAIKDSFEAIRRCGVEITGSTLVGGGAKNPLWRQIFADVLNLPLELPQTEEGPGYGAAMLAMVAAGVYETVEACAEKLVTIKERIEPDPERAALYAERYEKFCLLYPALKETFRKLAIER